MRLPLGNAAIATLVALWSHEASAHESFVAAEGWLRGVLHPISGPEHLVPLFALGFWLAFQDRRALVLLPLTFIGASAAGIVVDPLVPAGAASYGLIAAGVAVALAVAAGGRPPLWFAVLVFAAFAFIEGQTHHAWLEAGSDPLAQAFGAALASTGVLLTGALLGFCLWPRYRDQPPWRLLGLRRKNPDP